MGVNNHIIISTYKITDKSFYEKNVFEKTNFLIPTIVISA